MTRAVIFVGLTLALWALARPAHAMPAGLCDDRGATAVAPPPTLEPPESALERARGAVSCADRGEGPLLATVAPPGHRAQPRVDRGEGALPVVPVTIACAVGEVLPEVPLLPSTGALVRFRVERPPRG